MALYHVRNPAVKSAGSLSTEAELGDTESTVNSSTTATKKKNNDIMSVVQ